MRETGTREGELHDAGQDLIWNGVEVRGRRRGTAGGLFWYRLGGRRESPHRRGLSGFVGVN